ncbi:quaternary amine ABC transporter ATP-binding protein [Paracoccus aerius]|uniref:Quaternary amine transport ATP-binding protein n=2 Tax=Paracoccus aerius TaxID=1915382 RepID=A0ABS1S5J4_9RHOB|nr:glycine betaine/L-proline ABC transporter ATP-binding protein [Paracoccus aerius]MBL3673986.1 glycine betaine/L-proline ABC transporter ATP-binding protein [Paracoccus aerius]GHG23518.1 glycine/betaine ABC transporter ATP-binding protein [Paracoccus aerius]
MSPKLSVRHVFKIFGAGADEALARLRQGKGKEEILLETGATVGVQDTSFDVSEGEIFVVMGLSGSGKSTLVRMLNGLVPPTSGEICIDGEDVASCGPDRLQAIRREKIAMVFQHFALFPHWTITENVAYGLKIKGMPAAERRATALQTLEQVGLGAWADALPPQLSGGMQQRVGLARALATGPQILLMDEPFGALDPLIRREMQEELVVLQKTLKKTIIFITHDLNEALLLGDRIAIMRDGRFVQVGAPQEIVANPADDYVAAFVGDIDRGRVFRATDIARPSETLHLEDNCQRALDRMQQLGRNALYVLAADRIAGIVRYEDLVRDGGAPRDLLRPFSSTVPEAKLHELYAHAARGLPIAVLDDGGTLTGVVELDDLFACLAGGPMPTHRQKREHLDA